MIYTYNKSVFCGISNISNFTGTYTGPTGNTGYTGIYGPSPIGPTGLTGPIGFDGYVGPTGITGYTGITGPIGFDGYDGISGDIGLTGPTGPVGLTGTIGITGITGSNGPDGQIYSRLIQKYVYTIGSLINNQTINYGIIYTFNLPLYTTVIDVILCGGGGSSIYSNDGSTISSSSGGAGNILHLSRIRVNDTNQNIYISFEEALSGHGTTATFTVDSYVSIYSNTIHVINTVQCIGGNNAVIGTVSSNGSYIINNPLHEYYTSYIESAKVQSWNVGDDIDIIGAYPILDDDDVQTFSRGESIQITGTNSDVITTTSAGLGGIIIYCYYN